MTWLEVREGQRWRLVTATFVHFGLIHLTLNTLGLVNLGRLVEPWYRTGPFLAVCLAIGGLGNLLGGALRQLSSTARPWLASMASARHWPGPIERFLHGGAAPVSIHTGGGSTILLGLCTLAAVVGWRSRTRIGSHLQKQMVILLALTAVLGVAMYNLVDNYGHLGGAIVGAVIGLFDRPLLRLSDSKRFRMLCWTLRRGRLIRVPGRRGGRDDRVETDYRRQLEQIVARRLIAESTKIALDRLYVLYVGAVVRSEHFRDPMFDLDALALGDLLNRGPAVSVPSKAAPEQLALEREEMAQVLELLEKTPEDPWGEEVAADLARLRHLGRSSLEDPPSYEQVYDFIVCWEAGLQAVSDDLARLKAQVLELEKDRKRRR